MARSVVTSGNSFFFLLSLTDPTRFNIIWPQFPLEFDSNQTRCRRNLTLCRHDADASLFSPWFRLDCGMGLAQIRHGADNVDPISTRFRHELNTFSTGFLQLTQNRSRQRDHSVVTNGRDQKYIIRFQKFTLHSTRQMFNYNTVHIVMYVALCVETGQKRLAQESCIHTMFWQFGCAGSRRSGTRFPRATCMSRLRCTWR